MSKPTQGYDLDEMLQGASAEQGAHRNPTRERAGGTTPKAAEPEERC